MRIVIEDNVRIGGGCRIIDSDFHPIDYEKRMKGIEGRLMKPIRIEEGAFICTGSTILKGVTIGAHSVIGAGSVVTKSVPAGEIWAGNPAAFIRRLEPGERADEPR